MATKVQIRKNSWRMFWFHRALSVLSFLAKVRVVSPLRAFAISEHLADWVIRGSRIKVSHK